MGRRVRSCPGGGGSVISPVRVHKTCWHLFTLGDTVGAKNPLVGVSVATRITEFGAGFGLRVEIVAGEGLLPRTAGFFGEKAFIYIKGNVIN